ncbi:putative peptidyl-prolyl cis-trans isomerase [Lacunisphaera limnophila]|uniref:peptidylprolyl isomerase n=1 Tax=Lacunisphaera limnophila TaxID=1838286 RepID=A0A1D8AU41_9BACT|nr:peptidylprolyl isomerase [Lacunisphaera limnophila]AOS44390.1 putative peptidyl-prolyl cis-trans isomerase [Lacunisphaera limnophila]
MRFLTAFALLALVTASTRLTAQAPRPANALPELADGLYAEFTTPHGAFVTELHYQQAPLTVANFVGLTEGTLAARDGQPYYTGLKWYRVVPGFVIQSGNPRAPDDSDTGYSFPDELVPGLRHAEAGILSMANGGPDTNSGEFFLTLGDCTRLNYLHSVFGRVVRGLEVLPLIKPDDPFSVKILRRGAAAQAFRADEATFRALAAAAKTYPGTAEPGPTTHFDDPDGILPTEPPRARYFNYKLANYERVTGLKIVGRLSAQPPPPAEDEIPGRYMRTLAEKLGVARTGVLVAYLGEDDWRVWIGDEVVPRFLGRPVAPGDLGDGGALHDVKDALITAALKAGDEAYEAQRQRAPADRLPPPGQRIKLQTDALLDALLLHLEPK